MNVFKQTKHEKQNTENKPATIQKKNRKSQQKIYLILLSTRKHLLKTNKKKLRYRTKLGCGIGDVTERHLETIGSTFLSAAANRKKKHNALFVFFAASRRSVPKLILKYSALSSPIY